MLPRLADCSKARAHCMATRPTYRKRTSSEAVFLTTEGISIHLSSCLDPLTYGIASLLDDVLADPNRRAEICEDKDHKEHVVFRFHNCCGTVSASEGNLKVSMFTPRKRMIRYQPDIIQI